MVRLTAFSTLAHICSRVLAGMAGMAGTPASMFPLLWQHSGVDYETLVKRLIGAALERPLTVLR